MISLNELARQIQPERTILLFGAGSSVPSGGPTAPELADCLQREVGARKELSLDLAELASILELRYGREKLIAAVRKRMKDLTPTRGLLVVPEFEWYSIYTTNYDTLIEKAFAQAGAPVIPIRSNFEYGNLQNADGVPLFKIHGCLTQDLVDGSKARMVLTETDYEEYRSYREILFARLKVDMDWKDVLVVGQSLKDRHLADLMKEAAALHVRAGAPGRLFALLYEKDEDRAMLMENKGFEVAFGGIDDLMQAISERVDPARLEVLSGPDVLLPPELRAGTVEPSKERFRQANVMKLFNGSPASYADVASGVTFRRTAEPAIRAEIDEGTLCISILGVAGAGKTTLARRVLLQMLDAGWQVWEHHRDFPLRPQAWLRVEAALRENGMRGMLMIDNAPSFQRYVNMLVDGLAALSDSALRVLLVGEKSRWAPTAKTPNIFARGYIVELDDLDNAEVERIVTLAEQPSIRELVDVAFSMLPRHQKVRNIKRRCARDMFVSLKHMFGSEALDIILLQEFSQLSDDVQDIYRTVAALEAAGTRVHRQLIIRLLGIPAQILSGQLEVLEGLVDEYTISAKDGLYGWRTRHEVIAQIITKYKYADQKEFHALLYHVISHLNPTIQLELKTLVDLCISDFGIRRLQDIQWRLELYTMLIELAPGERIPRHRLVRELLELGKLDEAEHAIRSALEEVGNDPPLHRYRTLLVANRARDTIGLLPGDRRAMLTEAWNLAKEGLRQYPDNKYSYSLFEEIASTWYDVLNDPTMLVEAVSLVQDGFKRTLDPTLARTLQSLERKVLALPVKDSSE